MVSPRTQPVSFAHNLSPFSAGGVTLAIRASPRPVNSRGASV